MCAAPDFESSAMTRRKSSSALLNSPLFNACAPWEKSTEGSCAEVAVLCDQTSISFLPAGKVASGIAQRDWQPPAISRQNAAGIEIERGDSSSWHLQGQFQSKITRWDRAPLKPNNFQQIKLFLDRLFKRSNMNDTPSIAITGRAA